MSADTDSAAFPGPCGADPDDLRGGMSYRQWLVGQIAGGLNEHTIYLIQHNVLGLTRTMDSHELAAGIAVFADELIEAEEKTR